MNLTAELNIRDLFTMKATQARKIAEAATTGKLKEIYTAISKAAKRGDMETHVYFIIKPNDKKELAANGYKVTDVSERNETCICISWER